MFQLLTKKLQPVVQKSNSKEKKGINVNELKRKAKETGELADSKKSMSFKIKPKRDNEDLDEFEDEHKQMTKCSVNLIQEKWLTFKKD